MICARFYFLVMLSSQITLAAPNSPEQLGTNISIPGQLDGSLARRPEGVAPSVQTP
jgi:hypothetical protein